MLFTAKDSLSRFTAEPNSDINKDESSPNISLGPKSSIQLIELVRTILGTGHPRKYRVQRGEAELGNQLLMGPSPILEQFK